MKDGWETDLRERCGALLGGGRSARGSLEPASLHVSSISVGSLLSQLPRLQTERIMDPCGVNCEKARMPRPREPCLQGALSTSPFILNLPSPGEEEAESEELTS